MQDLKLESHCGFALSFFLILFGGCLNSWRRLSFFPGDYLVIITFCAIFAWNIIALWMRALALPRFDKPL